MQMNDQPAAAQAQSMQMNDLQAAAQAQFMQMNNPATTEELWQMNEEMMRRMEEDQIKILENKIRERNADVIRYRSLYRSIREKNWKAVEDFVNNDSEALNDDITELGQNIFHLLSQFDEAIGLLERVNLHGNTALIIAAVSGNTEAAKVFVSKNKKLLSMRQMGAEFLPIHAAAYCSRKETVEYLISVTAEVEDLTYESGAMLLRILIMSNLFGTTLGLLKQYPELARDDRNPYWRIPLQEEKNPYPLPERVDEDIEQTVRFGSYSAESEPFEFIQYIRATFAPSIRCIHDRKQMHTQTLEIVRMMIGDYSNWNYVKAIKLLKKPAFIAATLAIYEVAVLNRQERVFNLVYQVSDPMGCSFLSWFPLLVDIFRSTYGPGIYKPIQIKDVYM
ncbi:hypothetical protein ACOSQ2_020347 [Xanthoceras sorbifolium]